jgi:hypothetical protein
VSLVARIRALITLILLATWSPVDFDFSGVSVFTRRLTRVAAAEEFDVVRAGGASRCPSRYVRRESAARAESLTSFYDRSPDGKGSRA